MHHDQGNHYFGRWSGGCGGADTGAHSAFGPGLDLQAGWSIVRAIGDADADDDVRVVALTGNGDAFCAGLDLGRGDDAPVETGLSDQQQILDEKGWVGRFLLALRFETDKTVVDVVAHDGGGLIAIIMGLAGGPAATPETPRDASRPEAHP